MLKEAILAFTLFSLVMSAPTSKPEPVETTAVGKTEPTADGPQKGPQEPAKTTTNPETPKTSASKTNQVTSAPPQTTTKQEVPKNEPKTVAPEKKQVTKAPAETTQDEQDLMKWIQKMISDEKEIEHIVNDCDEEELPMQIQNENDIDYVPYNSDYDNPDDFYGSETEDDYNKDCISCY